MLSYFYIIALPDNVSFAQTGIVLGSWFGMGLVEPLRAGLAVASAWPLAVVASGRSPAGLVIAAIVIALTGVWAADAWEALVSVKDDRRIVIDEVAGYLAGTALMGRIGWLAAGSFAIFFLAFDRLKPWPFDLIEGVPGGIGVMLDDIVLGVSLGLLVLLIRSVGRWIARPKTSS